MRSFARFTFFVVLFTGCNNGKEGKTTSKESRIVLRTDSINVVKLTDTLVIYESTCRGCQYEGSTRFQINDSMGIIKLQDVITGDNNSGDMTGGSIGKELVLVPLKAGNTIIKLYKLWSDRTASEDSARFKLYTIEVKN